MLLFFAGSLAIIGCIFLFIICYASPTNSVIPQLSIAASCWVLAIVFSFLWSNDDWYVRIVGRSDWLIPEAQAQIQKN